jgi:hypothetical protein
MTYDRNLAVSFAFDERTELTGINLACRPNGVRSEYERMENS